MLRRRRSDGEMCMALPGQVADTPMHAVQLELGPGTPPHHTQGSPSTLKPYCDSMGLASTLPQRGFLDCMTALSTEGATASACQVSQAPLLVLDRGAATFLRITEVRPQKKTLQGNLGALPRASGKPSPPGQSGGFGNQKEEADIDHPGRPGWGLPRLQQPRRSAPSGPSSGPATQCAVPVQACLEAL